MLFSVRRRLCVAIIGIASSLFVGAALGQQSGANLGPLTPGGARPQPERQLPTEESPAVVIPPVSAGRPLEADEGPRIQVVEIVLDVEPALASLAGEERLAAARALVQSSLAAQPEGRFGIRELELVAESVTAYFRNNGFVLAWAYLPAQEVPTGRVQINVLAGRLGEVRVEGNNSYSAEVLSLPFQKLKGQPIELGAIESAVLYTRDYPGVSPSAVLSPGAEVGASDLTLRVSESPIELYLSGDNYGSYSSGQYRASAGLGWNNPLGVGDRLDLAVIQAFDPTENTYGSIHYELGEPWVRVWADLSTSAYDVGDGEKIIGADLDIDGESTIGAIGFRASAIRRREINLDFNFSMARKHAEFLSPGLAEDESGVASYLREDDLLVAVLGLRLDGTDRLFANLLGINELTLNYAQGIPGGFGAMDEHVGQILDSHGNGTGICQSTRQERVADSPVPDCAGGKFEKVSLGYQRVQRLTENNALLFRSYYQWSNDMLTSLEQVGLGGPYSLRGYPVAEALLDKGGFASLDWLFDVGGMGFLNPDRWNVTVFLFVDYGGGSLNDAPSDPVLDPSEELTFANDRANVHLADWGGGFELRYRPTANWRVDARVDIATPITDREAPSYDDDDPRVWGRLNVAFR